MIIKGCYFPENYLYEPQSNTWIYREGDIYKLGIDSILSWFFGKIISLRFYASKITEKGSLICSIEGIRRFDVIRAPFKFELIELNERIKEKPVILNKDPYFEGWIAKLNILEGYHSYKPIEEVKNTLEEKIIEYKLRCFSEFPDYEFFRIGVECSTVLTEINELFSKSELGTVVHVVSDDPTSPIEMIRWSEQTGQKFVEYRKEGELYHLIVKKIK